MKSTLVPAMVLCLAVPVAARAGDLCLDAAGGSTPTLGAPVIVGRGFSIPKKNKCKAFNGVMATASVGVASAVTGTACTSFNGTNVTFTLLGTTPPRPGLHAGSEVRYSVALTPQGTSAGTGAMTAFLASGFASTSPITAYECHNAYPDNL